MKTLSELMTDYRAPLLEAWDEKMHTAKKDKGMFKGKGKGEIGSALSKNKKTAENDRAKGKAEPAKLKKKIKQEEFALRAKNNFGKVSESIELREGAGLSFEHLLKQHHADVDKFIETDELTDGLFDTLYEYFFDEMPYGVAKARTGDPHHWISDKFRECLEREGLIGGTEITTNGLDKTEFSNPALGPNWGRDAALGESKTMRKCKGKGCKKTCPDGKEFCCAACKKSAGVKESYGPFSKKGYVVEASKKNHEKDSCELCNGKLSSKECAARLDSEGNVKKSGSIAEAKKREDGCDTKGCKGLANHNGHGGNYCSKCFGKKEKK
jgi:hypothetical protein